MSKGKDTEIKTIYDDLSVDELKEALKNIFFYAGEFTDADMEEMNKIMTVLERKEPTPPMYTAEESWKRFQETYSDELSALGVHNTEEVIQENPPADVDKVHAISEVKPQRQTRGRKLLRTAMVAAVIVVILIAAAATAYALGYDIFGWVPKWNDGELSFGEEKDDPNEFFNSSPIVIVLDKLGIEEPLYPHWLPEEYQLDVSVVETDPVFLHEGYSDGDRYLSITIEPSTSTENGIYQKDGIVPYEYCVNEHTHFIISDDEQLSATWNSGGFGVLLVGNVSLEEMKKMIDSVYEVKK